VKRPRFRKQGIPKGKRLSFRALAGAMGKPVPPRRPKSGEQGRLFPKDAR
jgi:hypothetical protein